MDIYFLYCCYLFFKLVLLFPLGALNKLAPVTIDIWFNFFVYFLTLCLHKMFQAHLISFLPQLQNQLQPSKQLTRLTYVIQQIIQLSLVSTHVAFIFLCRSDPVCAVWRCVHLFMCMWKKGVYRAAISWQLNLFLLIFPVLRSLFFFV